MSSADLRQAAVNYMIEHRISPLSDRPDFSTTFDSDRFSSFENYITTMAQDATYGDHLTLQALSELFFVQINVCSAQGKMYDRVIVPREGLTDLPIVYLGYFPEGNGEHYVSLETVVDFEVGDETVDEEYVFDVANGGNGTEEEMIDGDNEGSTNNEKVDVAVNGEEEIIDGVNGGNVNDNHLVNDDNAANNENEEMNSDANEDNVENKILDDNENKIYFGDDSERYLPSSRIIKFKDIQTKFDTFSGRVLRNT